MQKATRIRLLVDTITAVSALCLGVAVPATAATVDYSFNNAVSSTVSVDGSAPWLNLQISDTPTAGTVQLSLSTDLVSGTPQTLTGIWLNIPSVSGSVGSLTISGGSGTGQVPDSFTAATNPSVFSSTQSIVPAGSTNSVTGFYNMYLKFPNSGAGSSIQGVETETFDISGTGLTAASFYALAAKTAGGSPNPSYYAVAALTNAGGVSGDGIAYLSGTPVPLPLALPLFLSGISFFGLRRRGSTAGIFQQPV